MAFAVFAFLWASATLFHLVAYPWRITGVPQHVMALAALWVLLRPFAPGRLAILAGTQVVQFGWDFPYTISNHWTFAFVVNLTLLAALVPALIRRERALQGTTWFQTFAPVLRVELLVLYFFAVLHKLNTDFIDPEVSCVVDQYEKIQGRFPFFPSGEWMHPLLIHGTLFVEAGIPLLLLFRRTRVLGVFVGLAFHAALTLNPINRFMDFSSTVFALYFLFLPLAWLRERSLSGSVFGVRWGDRAQTAFRTFVYATGAVLVVNYAVEMIGGGAPLLAMGRVRGAAIQVGTLLWIVFAIGLAAAFLGLFVWRPIHGHRYEAPFLRPPYTALLLIPVLMALHSFSPYIGLSTENTFSMFSNLRTEERSTNHLFMPVTFRVAGYQEDMVRVSASTVPRLRSHAANERVLPFAELHRSASLHPDRSVTYTRGGETFVVPRIGDDPVLSEQPPLWQRKLLMFRGVESDGGQVRCTH